MISSVLLLHLILAAGQLHGQGLSAVDEVDRPVPVQEVHVSVGERVELACDVSLSPVVDYQGRNRPSAGRLDAANRRRTFPADSREEGSLQLHSADEEAQEDERMSRASRLSSSSAEEGAYLVLWFIDPDRKPVYSFDVRGRPVASGRHWWDERRFERRAHFLLASSNRLARLQITNVSTSDAGHYRCRVDFKNAPTRNFKYHLIVVEPPSSVLILDGSLQPLGTLAGPLEEGDDLVLTCKAQGGHPTPWVTWWRGGQLLDNLTDARGPDSVSNLLVLPRVTRLDLHDAFTCQVTSSPHVPPIMKEVKLELNLRPLLVDLSLSSKSISAEQVLEVRCRTAGSRPPPSITWWKGNKQILHRDSIVSSADGNVTTSVLTLTPTADDDREHLTCRVKNGLITGAVLEDSIRLDVLYAPMVRLSLGSNIVGDEIKEGDDLYIECHIRSNPAFHRLLWSHNGSPLSHNISAGIVLSNVSLVMRGVTRSRAGLYTCTAVNGRGETTSQPLRLRIQYAPRCRSTGALVVGVTKQETTSLECQVDTDPSDVHFWWTFLGTPMRSNGSTLITSSGDAILLSRSEFTSKGPRSVLRYSPRSEMDYGVVACWASNTVGNQKEPCLFHVVPAGKPVAPANCTVHNQTADSVRVDCQEAFDGGLQQTFGLELIDRDTRTLRYALNNSRPTFTVYGLEPETAFLLNIFALNAKGRSHEITLEATTLRTAEKHTGQVLGFQMTPLLGVLVGAAATLLLIVLVVAIVVHQRQKKKRQRQVQGDADARGPATVGPPHRPPSPSHSTPPPDDGSIVSSSTLRHGDRHQRHDTGPHGAPDAQATLVLPAEVKVNGNGRLPGGSTPTPQHYSPQRSCSSSPTVYHKDPDIILRDMDCHMKRVLPAVMKKNGPGERHYQQQRAVPVVSPLHPMTKMQPDDDDLSPASNWGRQWANVSPDLHPSRGNLASPTSSHWDGQHLNRILQRNNILSDSRLPESSL